MMMQGSAGGGGGKQKKNKPGSRKRKPTRDGSSSGSESGSAMRMHSASSHEESPKAIRASEDAKRNNVISVMSCFWDSESRPPPMFCFC